MTAKEVIKFMKEQKAVAVDVKFNDFLGIWQHFTVPISEVDEAFFEEGSGFDGSSIRGWQPIHASDMLVMPDPTTAVMDPFTAARGLDPHRAGLDAGDERGMPGIDAQLARLAGERDELGLAGVDALFGADDGDVDGGVGHYFLAVSFFISSALAKASSIVPTM